MMVVTLSPVSGNRYGPIVAALAVVKFVKDVVFSVV